MIPKSKGNELYDSVLANGTFVIRDENVDTNAFPGKAVRRPVIY
jgi:hypothetical protein